MNNTVKRALLAIPGFEAACRRLTQDHIRVLRYERFAAQEDVPGRLSKKALRRQMALLARHHSQWTPDQHVGFLTSGRFSGSCPVIVTVDGGYPDLVDVALPVFRDHDVRPTLFVAAGNLEGSQRPAVATEQPSGHPAAASDYIRPITAKQLQQLEDSGIRLGSLSPSVSALSQISPERWRQEIAASWKDLRQRTHDPLHVFGYQQSEQNEIPPELHSIVRESGFRTAYLATSAVPDPQDRFGLARYSPTEDFSDFRWQLCGAAVLLTGRRARRSDRSAAEPPIYATMRRWIGQTSESAADVMAGTNTTTDPPTYHPGQVGVVVTCYNYGRFLAGCIESILAQTYHDFEVVIVDDGSTDDTPAVAEQWRDDPRIHYVRQVNQGQAAAKNRGIRECHTEFIAFLDADDRWEPTKLAKQVALFANPQVGVVYSLSRRIDEDGASLPDPVRSSYFNARRGNILRHLIYDNFVRFSATVVRRVCLEETGGFKEYLPMAIDWDLWLRIAAQKWQFDYVPEALFQYRIGHGDQMSRKLRVRHRCSDQIMREFRRDYPTAISKRDLRRAQSYTLRLRGGYYERHNRLQALWLYAKSAFTNPWQKAAYRGIILTLLPFLKPLKDAASRRQSQGLSQP